MSAKHGNHGPRRMLLVTAAAAVLGVGGAGVAYASSHGPRPVESGYAVEISTQTGAATVTAADPECEKWRARQEAPAATTDVRGQL